MKVSVEAEGARPLRCELLVIPVTEGDAQGMSAARMPARWARLNRALSGCLSPALSSGDFRGRLTDELWLYPEAGAVRRVLLVGLGPADKLDAEALRRAAARAVRAAASRRLDSLALVAPAQRGLLQTFTAAALTEGAVLGCYRFDSYKQPAPDAGKPAKQLRIVFENLKAAAEVRRASRRAQIVAECQNTARELSNEPPNALPPAELASRARRLARRHGFRCKVMDMAELRRRKLGAILAVGQGSAHTPRIVVLEHNPPSRGARGKRRPTFCVVGKGVTFDSGGLSIKPALGMPEMKHDMSGAAAVVGILEAAARLELPWHVVGVIGAAENMPDGAAYRPSDVVRSGAGKTIEILNTDAEGRVVLADALHLATHDFSPRAVVDLATLTGACMVALGPWATGLFSNDDDLRERLRSAGEACGERAWPLPLLPEHHEAMRSQVADLRNAGGRDGGASTAAAFLAAFVGDTPWAHLDIAGTASSDKASPLHPVGATGVGVRLLVELLSTWKP